MKKKTNISDKALKLINLRQLRPIPKWEFMIRNWGLWMGIVVSIGLLTLGIGVSWFGFIDNIITPYLWLFIAIVFFGLSFLLFEKTKRAYRFSKWQVVTLIALVGIITGGAFFKIGLARQVDRTLESRVSFYRQMVPMRMIVWSNPEQGYLSGQIIDVSSNYFVVKDFNNKSWTIKGNPLIRGRVKMEINEEIKIIGKQINENSFEAEEIRPWNGMGQNMMKEK